MTHSSSAATLFSPDSPIPLAVATYILESLLAALPGYAAAPPDRQAELRQIAMALLSGFNPQDTAQAMLASSAIIAQLHANECVRLAGNPAVNLRVAAKHTAYALALLRCQSQLVRQLRNDQRRAERAAEPKVPWDTAPPKAEHKPMAPPRPRPPAAPPARQNPMPSGTPAATAAAALRTELDAVAAMVNAATQEALRASQAKRAAA